jgi:hypothetical protein
MTADVLGIGGSTAPTLLAQTGQRAVLLENGAVSAISRLAWGKEVLGNGRAHARTASPHPGQEMTALRRQSRSRGEFA